jgi:hypothetical protein
VREGRCGGGRHVRIPHPREAGASLGSVGQPYMCSTTPSASVAAVLVINQPPHPRTSSSSSSSLYTLKP